MTEFIDFGCGTGDSISFAQRVLSGEGFGIDRSKAAVDAAISRGFDARIGDLVTFSERNAAKTALSIDAMPELESMLQFEQGLQNMIRSCTNVALVQHSFFDTDAELACKGQYIKQNFSKKITLKPTTADYAVFAKRHAASLDLVGLAVLAFGERVPVSLEDDSPVEAPPEPRSIRVLFGRRDSKRFHRGLKLFGTGKALYVWNAA